MAKYDSLKKLLVLHEGRVNHIYVDSLGYLSFGVGHMADPKKKGTIPDEIIDRMFEIDLREHVDALSEAQPWVAYLSEVRLAVLCDMTFNLGIEPFDGDGFKDWPIFVQQVKDGKYKEAAANMRATLWAKQVGIRAERLATMMETDTWPSA